MVRVFVSLYFFIHTSWIHPWTPSSSHHQNQESQENLNLPRFFPRDWHCNFPEIIASVPHRYIRHRWSFSAATSGGDGWVGNFDTILFDDFTRCWQLIFFVCSPRKFGKMKRFLINLYFSKRWLNHQRVDDLTLQGFQLIIRGKLFRQDSLGVGPASEILRAQEKQNKSSF